ncbi:flavin-containing monooxygenase [Planococcus lenghuensis]|uniref:Oxidoreductase n=1 Tax=Planococcus lenghuensis TaxID=2213202 RepID=A0A1Q2KVF0_9BACL|nr:NAD(P)/FAD-dependent oxidoreductase [Planococcus lenghuensis]AQQ52195.1 hypothetical protein B0X71_03085 [Planococcus lenghuensis]
MKQIDVLIIGAGQAGLAAAYYLQKTDKTFVLLDGAGRIGDSWRNRYDSLVLFSPRRYSRLPGLAMTGDPEGYPGKDEFAAYLERYAGHFGFPVALGVRVEKMERWADGYRVVTTAGDYVAAHVIIATGPFQRPHIPVLPGGVPETLTQLHSAEYRSPDQLPDGPVAVIGGGNSGAQIAVELAESRQVMLATGHELVFIPQRIFGKSLFFWLGISGISRISPDSRLSTRLKKGEPVIGTALKPLIAASRVQIAERAVAFCGGSLVFQDGSEFTPRSIVWATGFRFDYNWLNVAGTLNEQGQPVHRRGHSPVSGLYFLGLPWLSGVCSGRINGVGRDAKKLVRQIVNPA